MSYDLALLNDKGDSPYAEPVDAPVLHTAFPELIDNTAREQYRRCPQLFFRSTIQKLIARRRSPDLHFGGAFAAGLEALRKAYYEKGMPQEEALHFALYTAIRFYGDYEPPVDKQTNKNFNSLFRGLVDYVDRYPLATDHIQPYRYKRSGKSAIEFTFAVPIPDTEHPVTGNPILYGGRFDMIGVFGDAIFGLDDKTTSQLGPRWDQQWKMSSQFTGYCWAAQTYGIPLAGFIIRGQSFLKDRCEFTEAIIYRSQWEIDRWLEQITREVKDMIFNWEERQFDYAIGGACAEFGGCQFVPLCSSRSPSSWIASEYTNHSWNPLHKDPLGDK